MKTTIVPAQITTVEDTIAGNLNLAQILLFVGALFYSTFIFAVLPAKFHLTTYKVPFILIGCLSFISLAIRIKGRIVFDWMIILARYHFRPRYYVFDKNTIYLRNNIHELPESIKKSERVIRPLPKTEQKFTLAISDFVRLDQLIQTKKTHFRFKFRKNGGMHVAVQ